MEKFVHRKEPQVGWPRGRSARDRSGEALITMHAGERFLGRDLSWLAFNRRVLAQAQDPTHPLLERVKFLTIVASNLDEFFMKRVALMKRRLKSGHELVSHDGRSIQQQLEGVRAEIESQQHAQAECFESEIVPGLAKEGIRLAIYGELTERDRARLDEWYRANVFPILTPLAVDPGHRFPFISNLSESLGVIMVQPGHNERLFARLKIPEPVARLVAVPVKGDIGSVVDPHDVIFVPQVQVIRNNLDDVFPGMEVVEVMEFRVTRSAGLEADGDEVENLLEHVEAEMRQRRFADPVRIETPPNPSDAVLTLLAEELELDRSDVYSRSGPMEYADLLALSSLERPDLKHPRWTPVIPARLRDDETDIFSVVRERDLLVHHPYESFEASVERFVAAAARDPHVLAIKQTLYRTSRGSPFIDSLIHAAEEGKAVACLVELRARFDEDKNVRFARQLEKHGVHVAYGVVGLKTHSKCSLVVRKEPDGLRTYAHVGTGNYHPGTAQLYTDCGLLTCNPRITGELVTLFNYLTGRAAAHEYEGLLVAPSTMRKRFYDLIDREIEIAKSGGQGRITAKMNALEDVGMIGKLYEASAAGVRITLIVRGFCCLRPGAPGLSDNIRVISIVGRYLEHSRIFWFGDGEADPVRGRWYIGSADWMSRNLSDRVEVAVPVEEPSARAVLHRIVEVNLADRLRAWELQPDGSYRRLIPSADDGPDSPARLGTFEALCREAQAALRPVGP